MIKFPSSVTTVTLFSKILAVILFFTFIILGFFAGMKYQEKLDLVKYQQANLVTAKPSSAPTPVSKHVTICTMEAKLCPDGKTSVGRTGPNCEFTPCP